MSDQIIKIGDYVVVQRQGYTKLHKLRAHGTLQLGSFNVEMDNIVGERYFDQFQMKNSPANKRLYTLEKTDELSQPTAPTTSGEDNRHITDDNHSQNLTIDQINQLKSEEFSSNKIVESLISNSTTFHTKTEFSQAKYIKKKQKKYFEFVQIRQPSIRLMAAMFYRQDPSKTLGIRIDDLGQILSYSNVQDEGNHLLYDSGTSGLLTAAIMDRIGSGTSGHLVHVHPGNECQKSAFIAMNFPTEQRNRCVNVNLYSVLRCFYQNRASFGVVEPENKRIKLDEDEKKPIWQVENERACKLLDLGMDSLVIAAKEHPGSIVLELATFLKSGRCLVVFSAYKETLHDIYNALKEQLDFVSIRISSNFMRNYQVLHERTHPEVNMTTGGYILSAYKLIK